VTRLIDVWRRAGRDQILGVAAQIFYAAPSLVASLFVARWAGVSFVASLALTVGVSSTVFSASSFGLTPYLALFGVRDFSQEVFWLNRVLSSLIAMVVAALLLFAFRAPLALTAVAVLLKCSDSMADVAFGLDLLRVSPSFAIQRLFTWSARRLAIFTGVTYAAHALGQNSGTALLTGTIAQFAVMLPWHASARVMITRDRLREAIRLARSAAHLSVASTTCGVFVTTPRLLAVRVVARADLGYVGIAFIASTLIGMCFNVAWLRLADSSRLTGARRAVIAYLLEGSMLSLVLVAGLWISRPLAGRAYHVHGERFEHILMIYGSVYVFFYFVMAITNLLKLSNVRLAEARAYLVGAAVLVVLTLATGSLPIGLFGSTVALAGVVYLTMRSMSGQAKT
jgi:hypothetical protein